MIKSVLIILASLQLVYAADAEVYRFALYANGDNAGKCRAAAAKLGREIENKLDAEVPGFTPYYGEEATRFLRATHRALQEQDALISVSLEEGGALDSTISSINLCNRTFCSKPANWQICLWNGCRCSCGGRRELVVSASAENAAKVSNAKKSLDSTLVKRGKDLGCTLGLEMTKISL